MMMMIAGAPTGQMTARGVWTAMLTVTLLLAASALGQAPGYVQLYYGAVPSPTVTYPDGGEVVNGTVMVTGTATDAEGNWDIRLVEFYAYYNPCSGGSTSTFIGNASNTSDTNWNRTWDTTVFSDSSFWRILMRAYDNTTYGEDYSNGKFTVNNVDQEPEWEEFKNPLSTNLSALNNASQLNDWIAVTDLVLARPDEGMLNWSQQSLNVDNAPLDSGIEISHGVVQLDNCGLEGLDVPAYVHLFNLSIVEPIPTQDGGNCSPPDCDIISYSHTNFTNGTFIYRVTDFVSPSTFVTYSVRENLTMSAWDQNDSGMPFGGLTAFRNTDVWFFANYTSTGGPLPQSAETLCQIRLNVSGSVGSLTNMTYNSTKILFEYSTTFSVPSFINWEVFCDSTLVGYYGLNRTGNLTVPNRPPLLLFAHPNVTMFENTLAVGVDLDDYFSDPDGDALTYQPQAVTNINISVNATTGVVSYRPDTDFTGSRLSYFNATDTYGATTASNVYNITVLSSTPPPPPPPPPPAGGGGAGASILPFCPTNFECTDWSDCRFKLETLSDVAFLAEFTGYETRVCTDLNDCGLDHLKPDEVRGCNYQPTCFDLLLNQDEEGVDCGGPCPPCPSCLDGIRNQGESGVDCGGPCPACPTCFDGQQNQEEEGVDCGGPCPPCSQRVIPPPEESEEGLSIWLLLLMLLMVLLALAVTYRYARPYLQRAAAWLRMRLQRFSEVPVPEPTLLDLERRTLIRLHEIEQHVESADPAQTSAQLARVMREFLRGATGLAYQFTYEEMLGELQARKVGGTTIRILKEHFSKLNRIEFGKTALSRLELGAELQVARTLVRSIVRTLARSELASHDVLQKREAQKQTLSTQKALLELNKAVSDAEEALLQGKLPLAKALYNKARSAYLRLPQEQRKQALGRIRALYGKITGEQK